GVAVPAVAMSLPSQLQPGSSYLTSILPAEILLGSGIACVMVPASSLATSRVDFRDAGIASAALNSAQQIGASLGIAVLNTLAASTTAAHLIANTAATRADALV